MITTTPAPANAIDDATGPLWIGAGPKGWADVIHSVLPDDQRTAAEIVVACGLGWHVEQHPLYAIDTDTAGEETRRPVPRYLANVRSDTGRVLGVVGDSYQPLQNRDAFALADDLIDSGQAHWIGAGATRGGARIHALMRLDRDVRIGGADGEDILPLLLLRNGHDGGLALTVSVAPFRLACLNGMLLPVEGAVRTWKARHTRRIADRLGDARRTLQVAWRYYDALEETGERLIREPLSAPAFERFLTQLVPLPTSDADPGGRRVRNAESVREAIRSVYLTTPDLDAIRGTAWGALQAVADYHDHHARTRRTTTRTTTEARFERATEPAGLKDRALELLTA
jgi:phage/plasmid-like protein (TIGR03299 family)